MLVNNLQKCTCRHVSHAIETSRLIAELLFLSLCCFLKADMNSDRWQPYFSNELLSETEYCLGVCHGWFNLRGLPQAARDRSEIYKMKNSSCPQWDSNSRPLDSEVIT